jgi:hypothetical protein
LGRELPVGLGHPASILPDLFRPLDSRRANWVFCFANAFRASLSCFQFGAYLSASSYFSSNNDSCNNARKDRRSKINSKSRFKSSNWKT